MALSASMVWEVRTTGATTNGGGFKAGASGTDWSQQDAAQYSVTDGVTDGTTTITSATANFGTDVVGNVIYVQGGTGSITAGWYEITVRNSSTSITVDRSTGLTAGTGVTLKIGGALSTLAGLAAVMVASNKAFVKAGSGYSSTATTTFSTSGVNVTPTAMPNRLIGYTTTRGDGGQATLTLGTNTGLTGLLFSNSGWMVENIHVNCSSLGTSIGIQTSGNGNWLLNCKVSNATLRGIFPNGAGNVIHGCEVTGCGSSCEAGIRCGSSAHYILACNVHDNSCPGIQSTDKTTIKFCRITNNTGASSDGITGAGQNNDIENNTIYGSGRHGIFLNTGSSFWFATFVRNNILSDNAGYGIKGAAAGCPAGPWWDGNAFYNNTSGTRNQLDDTSTNAVNGVSPYTNVLDVVITDGSPFTNAAGGDFTLNNTALRGALLRGTATPGAMPGVAQVGYMDFGCFQAQAGGGPLINGRLVL